MLQFLLDTDHLTLYHHKHPMLIGRLAASPVGAVGITPISIEETLRGRLAVLARSVTGQSHVEAYSRLVSAVEMFRIFPIVPFDAVSEAQFQNLRAARLRIGTLDLKIAAIALTNNLTVLTRNSRDFGRIPGLGSADWSA